jgi:hypothetical protein
MNYTDLEPGREYYIKTHDYQGYHKEMIFVVHETSENLGLIMIFRKYPTNMMSMTTYYSFYEEDCYYDPEKIKENAQLAKQSMEQRALGMILKRLVNEHFEWL